MVIVCNTSCAPVLVLVVVVAVPTAIVALSVILLLVYIVLSIYTFISVLASVLVTLLAYSLAGTSGFVVPLIVIFIFGLLASLVSIDAFSFTHSVRYFGLMVP